MRTPHCRFADVSRWSPRRSVRARNRPRPPDRSERRDPCSVGGGPAALLGAIAAPVIVAGAAVSDRPRARPPRRGRAPTDHAPRRRRASAPTLSLVPDPPDPYRAPPQQEEARRRTKPSPAFQFNETATNVATAVTGAMVVGAVIATIVHAATQRTSTARAAQWHLWSAHRSSCPARQTPQLSTATAAVAAPRRSRR